VINLLETQHEHVGRFSTVLSTLL